jgi:hypothetical protein
MAAATVRLYYLFKEFDGADFIYIRSDLVLWMAAEIAAGFLVMGLPSLPKVFRALPGSGSMMSFFKSIWRGLSGEQENSRRGLPSWFKPSPKRALDSSITGTTKGGSPANMVFVTSWDPCTQKTTTTITTTSGAGSSESSLKAPGEYGH